MPTGFWRAPRASAPVRGSVTVPGSKSITNRALILASLSDGPSVVHRPLMARDTSAMINGLRSLGHSVNIESAAVDVQPHLKQAVGAVNIDCDQAGTVMRFLPAVATLAIGDITFDVETSARSRPMGPVMGALRTLGAQIAPLDSMPFTVRATGSLTGGEVTLDASASSQFVSALLLVAARAERGITVQHRSDTGADVPSLPHIDMTIAMLRAHGVIVNESTTHDRTWSVAPGNLASKDWHIEPDLPNALPFLVAAAVTQGSVRIPGLGHSNLQPLTEVTDVLTAAGCAVTQDGDDLVATGPTQLLGIDVDLSAIAETAVTFAAMCAYAATPSVLRGIEHIRGHETDRVMAIQEVLGAVGCATSYEDGALTITPGSLKPAHLQTFGDHRMATAAAIIGLGVDGVTVDDVSVTSKTMPNFVEMWQELLTQERP